MSDKLSIKEVSYNNPKDLRILKACLIDWFKNPKDLNLTSPTMRYPFDFKQWIQNSYLGRDTATYVLKKNDWIIGHMGLNIRRKKKLIHIFHLFIDRQNRGFGYSKILVEKAISLARENNFNTLSLFVSPINEPAISLYKSYDFKSTGEFSSTGSPMMILRI